MHNGYPGGGAGTLIFSYTKAWPISAILGDLKFSISTFIYFIIIIIIIAIIIIIIVIILVGGGGFRKLNHYWECRFCGYFFGDHHRTGLFLGFVFMHLQVFFFKFKV